MAGATVGKKQRRSPGKRQHNPTNRLGVNVALKDHQVLYATENRSLKDNRRLLMVPGFRSKKVFDADAPALPVFPVNVLVGLKPAQSIDIVLPQSGHPLSSITPAVVDAQLPTGGGDIHQQNADVASSMSAAPFAASRGDGGDGDGDDDNSSSYRRASDYSFGILIREHHLFTVITMAAMRVTLRLLIMMSIFPIKMVITAIYLKIYFKHCLMMPTSIALPGQH